VLQIQKPKQSESFKPHQQARRALVAWQAQQDQSKPLQLARLRNR
jgi:hypothetical protein